MAKKSGYKNKNIGTLGKKTQWKKGQSGNPAGKPRGSKHFKTLLKEALMLADENGERIDTKIIKQLLSKASKGDLKAIEMVMDRTDGKVDAHVKVDGDIEVTHGLSQEKKDKLRSLLP